MKRLLLIAAALAACALLACCSQADPPQEEPAPARPTPEPAAGPFFELEADVNPYTGLAKGEDYPEGVRGVAVMINNVRAALPQSGISTADLLYETVTESGITRMMGVWRDYVSMPTVGPIRSARDQHVQLMIPLGCLYAHIGTSTYAAEMLETYRYEEVWSIDGRYRNFYWIDAERRKTRDQEHCVFTNGETFGAAAAQYGLDLAGEPAPAFRFVRYDEPARQLAGGEASEVYIRFSSYAASEFRYDEASGKYYKWEFDAPQMDESAGVQYGADNLLLLFASITKYPDGVLSQVNFSQQGAGLYFCGGRYEKVRWIKGAPNAPLRIVDQEGTETDLFINPGQTYIALVGDDQIENCRINEVSLADLNA